MNKLFAATLFLALFTSPAFAGVKHHRPPKPLHKNAPHQFTKHQATKHPATVHPHRQS
jgi:hypothetical protein